MKTISLGNKKGKVCLIDDKDYDIVSKYKWNIHSRYAATREDGRLILMHRLLLQAPNDLEVDHKNGNGLDNRRCNIRLATISQNQMNKRIAKNNKSGYKGVCWYPRYEMWRAYIKINRRTKALGYFRDKTEAASAYNEAANTMFGEYALLNSV